MLKVGDKVLFKNRINGRIYKVLKSKHKIYYQIMLDGTVLKDSSISYLVVEEDLKLLKRNVFNFIWDYIVILKLYIKFRNYDY